MTRPYRNRSISLWARRMDYGRYLPAVTWWEQQAPKGRYMLEVHRRYVDWLKEAEDERR